VRPLLRIRGKGETLTYQGRRERAYLSLCSCRGRRDVRKGQLPGKTSFLRSKGGCTNSGKKNFAPRQKKKSLHHLQGRGIEKHEPSRSLMKRKPGLPRLGKRRGDHLFQREVKKELLIYQSFDTLRRGTPASALLYHSKKRG